MGTPSARAEGVSPSKVSLPSGPGSLEGIGENASPNINMGLVNYAVPLDVPKGRGGLSPSLSLSYSSAGGSSLVGMGWSFSMTSIERMTSQGLPRYDASDMMAADGGSELVRLPGTDTYRARFEGSFTRYRWHDPSGAGREGFWTAEHPDGRIGYYGARANGQTAPDARVTGPDGTFRWYLTELVDPLGHKIRYQYAKDGTISLLHHVSYTFDEAGIAQYRITLSYEQRPDHLVDAKSGFVMRQTKRLAAIETYIGNVLRRRYVLAYQLPEHSGGLSRLDAVHHYGVGGVGPHAVAFRFEYSDQWWPGCDDGACRRPRIHQMTSVGADFRTGAIDLIDINGDALPDVVDTTGGVHTIHLNELTASGQHRFRTAKGSTVATGGSANLSSPLVQMFDLNGDGFSDLIDGANSLVYWNRGTGDWDEVEFLDIGLPDFGADADLRFFDWDNDKAIDVLHADQSATWVFVNRDGQYDTTETFTQDALGLGFATDGVQLSDMNGDGLQDAVLMLDLVVAYRPNLGYGRFGDWVEMTGSPDVLASEIQFTDVNGDSLSDALVILGNEVRYALNEDGLSFGAMLTVSEPDGGSIPERTSEVSVRLADMNGNGSTDVVWIDASGLVTYLELEPIRPNLLTRVTNGLGKVIEMTYGTSVSHMTRDGGPSAWARRLPQPHQVLDELTHYDSLHGVREIREFFYHDGFYDGVDQQFRGFENVDVLQTGDDTIETALSTYRFDVGVEDRYRHGLLLSQEDFSAGEPLQRIENTYEDCELAGVPAGLDPPVRYMCSTATTRHVSERRPADETVTIREEMSYDAYGNVTLSASLGVVGVGGGGCPPCDRDVGVFGAPCGSECVGDESYSETEFIEPSNTGGRWLLRVPYRTRSYADPEGDLYTEELTYYDGEPFVGLPLGTCERGLPMRADGLLEPGTYISQTRSRYDDDGNIVETLDANGHRRRFVYNHLGTYILSEQIVMDDREDPYTIRMDIEMDALHERVTRSTDWYIPEDGPGTRRRTTFAFDAFSRLTGVSTPLDPSGAPQSTYDYDLGDPVSRIVVRQRSRQGGPLDLQAIQCIDGSGRAYQNRTRLDDGSYEVRRYQLFNAQGQTRRDYPAFNSPEARCDQIAFADRTMIDLRRDAKGRLLKRTLGDEEIFGTATVERTDYGPRQTARANGSSTDPSDPRHGVVEVSHLDGMNRPVRYETAGPDGTLLWWIDLTYDGLGNFQGWVDAEGNTARYTYDRLGRIVRHDDPSSGVTTFEFDDVDNLVKQTRADGVVMRFAYDEVDRLVAQWDEADPEGTRIEHLYDRAVDCPVDLCTHVVGERSAVRYPVELTDGETAVASEVLGYDVASRPVFNATIIDGMRYETRFDLDLMGRLRELTLPDGGSITYRYDARSRVTAIPGYVADVSYSVSGLISEVVLANGVTTTYIHDVDNSLASMHTVDSGGRFLQDFEVARDRVGNIVAITDHIAAEGIPSANARFSYDLRGRLAAAVYDADRPVLEEALTYGYDVVDNLVLKTSSLGEGSPAHVGMLEYGGEGVGPYAVTRAGDETYDYNAAGLMTRHGQDTYTWDFMGRLASVHRGNEELARFAYGEGEERLAKVEGGALTLYLGSDFEIRDGVSTMWLRLGDQRVAKIERAGFAAETMGDLAPLALAEAQDALTVRGDGAVTAADAMVAHRIRDGDLTLPETDPGPPPRRVLAAAARSTLLGPFERVTYLHANALGSTALTTDQRGGERLRSEYYPYGETRYSSRGYLEDYSYRGKERDEATGLTYFGARYLDPRLGRWVSPDLAFATVGPADLNTAEASNRYVYALNSPMTFKDERGRASESNFNRNGNSGGFSSASVTANYSHMHGFAWRVRTRERGAYQKLPSIQMVSPSKPAIIERTELGTPVSFTPKPKPVKAAQSTMRITGWDNTPRTGLGANVQTALQESVSKGSGLTITSVGTSVDNKDDMMKSQGDRPWKGRAKFDPARVAVLRQARAIQGVVAALDEMLAKMGEGDRTPENSKAVLKDGGTTGKPTASVSVNDPSNGSLSTTFGTIDFGNMSKQRLQDLRNDLSREANNRAYTAREGDRAAIDQALSTASEVGSSNSGGGP